MNGDFAKPKVSGIEFPTTVEGWTTTDAKKQFEIWKSGTKDPVTERIYDAPKGIQQFAEVAANSHSTLTQVVTGIKAGNKYGFSFWHRGRHEGDTKEDKIEVTVKDGSNKAWTKTFSTTAKEWKQYTVPVGTKSGTGAVTLSFESKVTALNSEGAGNFLTGIKLDETVAPPPCVVNAPGSYDWSAGRGGVMQKAGIVILSADNRASRPALPTMPEMTGSWQISNDCEVLIDFQGNGRAVLKATDGNLNGKDPNGNNITGVKKK